MAGKDPRVDDYIRNAAGFAQPILQHLRKAVHRACPEIKETIKWGMPHFESNGPVCFMAAFKEHCAFGFKKAELVLGKRAPGSGSMGDFGRVTRLSDLPGRKQLETFIRRAARLNADGIKSPSPKAKPARIQVPRDLRTALQRNARAQAAFDNFSPSHRREYVNWILEAKREATRQTRIMNAVTWLAEGKPRHWKHS